MEFKVDIWRKSAGWNDGINRIRLEFKVDGKAHYTDAGDLVLIESDWNLKLHYIGYNTIWGNRINRIRLEFKDKIRKLYTFEQQSINRIRLEFKGPDIACHSHAGVSY